MRAIRYKFPALGAALLTLSFSGIAAQVRSATSIKLEVSYQDLDLAQVPITRGSSTGAFEHAGAQRSVASGPASPGSQRVPVESASAPAKAVERRGAEREQCESHGACYMRRSRASARWLRPAVSPRLANQIVSNWRFFRNHASAGKRRDFCRKTCAVERLAERRGRCSRPCDVTACCAVRVTRCHRPPSVSAGRTAKREESHRVPSAAAVEPAGVRCGGGAAVVHARSQRAGHHGRRGEHADPVARGIPAAPRSSIAAAAWCSSRPKARGLLPRVRKWSRRARTRHRRSPLGSSHRPADDHDARVVPAAVVDAAACRPSREKYPDIDLRIHTSPQLVDFLRSECQAAVRFGVGDWPQPARREGAGRVARAGVLEGAAGEARPDPYSRRSARICRCCTRSASPGTSGPTSRPRPKMGAAAAQRSTTPSPSCARPRQGRVLRSCAGVLRIRTIRDGKLVLASPRIVKAPRWYYFVCPPSYISMEKIAAFREWLLLRQAAAAADLTSIVVARQSAEAADRRGADAARAHVGDHARARLLLGKRGRKILGIRRHARVPAGAARRPSRAAFCASRTSSAFAAKDHDLRRRQQSPPGRSASMRARSESAPASAMTRAAALRGRR